MRSQNTAAERVMGSDGFFYNELAIFVAEFPVNLPLAVAGNVVADLEHL